MKPTSPVPKNNFLLPLLKKTNSNQIQTLEDNLGESNINFHLYTRYFLTLVYGSTLGENNCQTAQHQTRVIHWEILEMQIMDVQNSSKQYIVL